MRCGPRTRRRPSPAPPRRGREIDGVVTAARLPARSSSPRDGSRRRVPCMASWTREDHDGVAVLTFRRPPSNWMDLVSMGELADHLAALAEQTDAAGGDAHGRARRLLHRPRRPRRPRQAGQGRAHRGRPHLLVPRADACSRRCRSPRSRRSTARRGAAGARRRSRARCGSAPSGPTWASRRSPSASSPAPGGPSGCPRLVGGAIGAELCLTGRIVAAEEAHGSAC